MSTRRAKNDGAQGSYPRQLPSSPRISVVIPTYNRIESTFRAIESVKTSNPDSCEIIVVDDAGSQAFPIIGCSQHGVRVVVVRCTVNGGAGLARALGVKRAGAPLIAFLDSDDEFAADWIDSVLAATRHLSPTKCSGMAICGRVVGGRTSARAVMDLLQFVPHFFQLTVAKVLAIMFNPFYTPAVVLGAECCGFHPTLRHCEDYFTNAHALFRATELRVLPAIACRLGRPPKTVGGLSSSPRRMWKGELDVRLSLLVGSGTPFLLRLLVPLGILYQMVRMVVSTVVGRIA